MSKRTVEDVAHEYHVQPATIRAWVRDGRLEAVKIGRRLLISDDALAAMEVNAATHGVDKAKKWHSERRNTTHE